MSILAVLTGYKVDRNFALRRRKGERLRLVRDGYRGEVGDGSKERENKIRGGVRKWGVWSAISLPTYTP